MKRININRHLAHILRFFLSKPAELLVDIDYLLFDKRKLSRENEQQQCHSYEHPTKIDAVYTWVDDSDENWREQRNHYLAEAYHESGVTGKSTTSSRFHNRDELKYSLRSLFQYAKFINKIHIVTEGHLPKWLNIAHPKINIVLHKEIFSSPELLPTFNSHAIESRLHHIPGLSEQYIYLNDDFFIGKRITPQHFFSNEGKSVLYIDDYIDNSLEPLKYESALSWSIKNSSKLINEKFGQQFCFRLKHSPYPMRKSSLMVLEEMYKDEFRGTEKNKFRHMADIGVTTSLIHYYELANDRAIRKEKPEDKISTQYINVNRPLLKAVLKRLLYYKKYDFYCINEPFDENIDTEKYDVIVTEFLERYYPKRSEYELPIDSY